MPWSPRGGGCSQLPDSRHVHGEPEVIVHVVTTLQGEGLDRELAEAAARRAYRRVSQFLLDGGDKYLV